MQRAIKSIPIPSGTTRTHRSTGLLNSARLAVLPVPGDQNEVTEDGSYVPILLLVPNTKAFERMMDQFMPEGDSGLRILRRDILAGKPLPTEMPSSLVNALEAEIFSFGEVTVNVPEMDVRRRGKPVTMPVKEFRMLTYLLRNPGRVIARDELLNEVWGYQNYPCTRTVDNHILRLRQKLEVEPSNPRHLLTMHSAGYKFVP